MDSNEINLSSLTKKTNSKTREKDDYILSKVNISRKELEEIDDEKYQKILEVIEEKLKEREANKLKQQEEQAKTTENKTATKNKNLINTDTLISNNNKKVEAKKENEKETKELKIEEEKEEKIETSELFSNYKSDFKKEENKFFKNIREKRQRIKERLRMPKTRVSLVVGLILLTIISISALFTLDPEHHSYKAYKANILNIKAKYIDKNTKNTFASSYETIQIEGFYFKIEKINNKNGVIYKYNSNTFQTKSELNIYLNKEVQEKMKKLKTLTGSALEEYKQEIIREALKNKYQQ